MILHSLGNKYSKFEKKLSFHSARNFEIFNFPIISIQTLASFSMLVFYTLDFSYLFYFFLFFKLGIFPFISWYLNVLYRFPSFVLLLSRTLHKLPPLFLFLLVYNSTYSSFILLSVLLSLIVGGFYMLNVLDLRYLIVVSSMANNGFLLLGLI